MPCNPTSIKYLSREQTIQFFSAIQTPREVALFATIYHFGLRVSEATMLDISHVDFERKRIRISRLKNGYGGEWPLLSNTTEALQAYLPNRLQTDSALFTGRQGGLKRLRIQQLFKMYAQKAGLNSSFSVHSLRHSIATHLLEGGFGIEYVQSHLGHVNISNTLIYAQLTNRRRDAIFQEIEHCEEVVKV